MNSEPFRLLRKESRDISPMMSRKQRKKMSTDSMSRGKYGQIPQQQTSLTDNTTVFFLPGVDVKVTYDPCFLQRFMYNKTVKPNPKFSTKVHLDKVHGCIIVDQHEKYASVYQYRKKSLNC